MEEPELSSGDWLNAEGVKALAKGYDIADAHAARAAAWYTQAMKRRGRWARILRALALLFIGLGSLLPLAKPVLASLLGEARTGSLATNDLGYVSLALGAALLGFDYFFGISSAYTRFVTTELAIKNARVRLHTEWLALMAASQAAGAGSTQLGPLATKLHEFVETVLSLVDRETQEWVAEFRSSLSELDRLASKRPGAAPHDGAGPPPGPIPVKAPARLEARPAAAPAAVTPAPEHLAGANGSFARPPAQAVEGQG